MPFQNERVRWYGGGKWLYLKNENGGVCQFRYNTNNSDDKILLEELKKNVFDELYAVNKEFGNMPASE